MTTNGKETSIRSGIYLSRVVLILAAFPLLLSACAGGGLFSRTDLVRATPSDSEIIWRDFTTQDDPVNTIAVDGDNLWMGTMKGIIRFNTRKREYEIFTPENTGGGFVSKGVYIISVDPKGNKWVGTYGGGLSRFDGEKWERFSNADGLGDNWIYDIVYDRDGVMWVATWDGVSVFDGERFKTYGVSDGLADKWVYSITLDQDGVFWFGTEAGVSRFDRKTWTTYTHKDGMGADIGEDSERGNVVSRIPLAEGSLSGGERGYGASAMEHHMTEGKQNIMANPDFIISAVVDRENNKWFGTWGSGVARFDGTVWTNYTTEEGLGGNYIFALNLDREGRVWAGTNGGASWFDGTRWTTIDKSKGLQDENVLSILFDKRNRRWFGTTKGLSMFRGSLPSE